MLTWRGLRQMLINGQDGAVQPNPAFQEAPQDGVIEVGDFRINVVDRTATLREQKLLLTSNEFDVLVFLAGHPQRLVTRQTILATSSSEGCPNRTDFLPTLLSLRAKLDAAGAGNHYLRTEPWIVYRFEPNPSLGT